MSQTIFKDTQSKPTLQSNRTFITDDFLLQNDFARLLYHDYAQALPIIDYHCHLSPQDIAENRRFNDVTEVWLAGDHYKWRAMRTLGINEKYITGDASPADKFKMWGQTVPYTLRNPLFHWTHLELQRYFGIDTLLTEATEADIFKQCNEKLQRPDFHTQGLIKMMNVETICTTDDPADTLQYHQQLKGNFSVTVLPAFRPDKAYAVEDAESYTAYLQKLGAATNTEITNYDDLLIALENSINYFHDNGCRLSDHGLENLYYFTLGSQSIDHIFAQVCDGKAISEEAVQYFKFHTLLALSKMYHKKGWTQQFHLGALRNTNERMLSKLGPDTGFDSIGDFSQSKNLANFLNELDKHDQLAKTILYNLNPADNEVMATMIGNFNDGSVKGKVQFGSAWWFLDQKDGMEKQMNTLSNLGILSCFIGMLTDSRSFLSFPRHEYFRRVLCNLIGKDVENGELPADEKWLGKIVSDICYHNAKNYFQFPK